MTSFEFADCPTSVTLQTSVRDGKAVQGGTLLLTLRNRTGRAANGRISIRPGAGNKPAWFAIDGAPSTNPGERDVDLDGNATASVKVAIVVPPDGAAGNYIFAVRVAAENDPDNDFVDSPSVAFTVSPSAPPAKAPQQKFPWWAVAVAAALVIVLGSGAAWWAMRDRGMPPPNVLNQTVDAAKTTLQNAGYKTTIRFGDPTGKARNTVTGQGSGAGDKEVALVLDPGTPKSVIGQKLAQAEQDLKQAGYSATFSYGRQTGKRRDVVISQSSPHGTDGTRVSLELDPGPPTFSREPHSDRPGYDIKQIGAPSADACATACGENDDCKAFNWNTGNQCWLKWSIPNRITSENSTSGAIQE
ncbi:PAN domain-containing protein [Bradyrhizobium sp. SZCCHNS3051]|uniref:PAN domain-containing protein n=1 Tax=Bradyrhizobium sp. SZCCHNS3051 TaxID=3057320 RepID=UPI0029161B03|nr:PAN domain-containing protein [Bradyrhizobium sp. SZCCHNS3051]